MQDKPQDQPATKADVQNLKTSLTADLQAVKADVQVLKTDVQKLSETVTRVAVDLSKTQEDVRQIKDDMETKMATKSDINRIMNALDTYTAEAISYRNRDVLRGNEVMAHTAKLKNHEDRLVVLESKK